MKVWIKILAGSILGLLVGFFLPVSSSQGLPWLELMTELGLRLSRYILYPLVFTGLIVALYDLKKEIRLRRVFTRSLLYSVASSLILTFIGGSILAVFPPQRIPILSRSETSLSIPSFLDIFSSAFPKNALEVFTRGGDFLLPIFIFALILGLSINPDKREHIQPTINFFDSLSRILYRVNSLVVEIIGFVLPFISAYMIVSLRSISEIKLYVNSALLMALVVLIALLGIFPIIYFFITKRKNPYKVLFANLGASIMGFFSGDVFAAQGILLRQSRENLGVSRKVAGFTTPFLALFSRGGTTMVSLIGFYVVLRTYSSLDVTLEQFFWSLGASFLAGFLLPSVPGLGAYISLTILCQWYGKGLESAYLNLAPIIVWMSSFAALADVTISGLITTLIGHQEGVLRQIDTKKFI